MTSHSKSQPSHETRLLDHVRKSAAHVAKNAKHVTIHEDKIADYVADLFDRYTITTALDDNHFVSKDREETASYVLALDSLNFGSGYFREARDKGIALDYTIFANGLKEAFSRGEMNTPEKWVSVTEQDFSNIFNIAAGTNESIDKLFKLFTHHLRATGQKIVDEYQGKTMNLIKVADGSAAKLVEMLAQWPTFHDFADYRDESVPILKRAQITAADLNLAGVADFKDIDQLTIFADNRVPHVLRCDGILSYSQTLADKIDHLVPLVPGSPEEVELRAASIHVAELMKAAIKKQGRNVTSVNIDHILWHRGAEPEIKQRPTHRTKTVWY